MQLLLSVILSLVLQQRGDDIGPWVLDAAFIAVGSAVGLAIARTRQRIVSIQRLILAAVGAVALLALTYISWPPTLFGVILRLGVIPFGLLAFSAWGISGKASTTTQRQ